MIQDPLLQMIDFQWSSRAIVDSKLGLLAGVWQGENSDFVKDICKKWASSVFALSRSKTTILGTQQGACQPPKGGPWSVAMGDPGNV